MNDFSFLLTDKAIAAVKARLEKRGTLEAYLRVGLKGGACEGYSYHIQFDDKGLTNKDYELNCDGVKILIDKKSAIYLNGATLDYEQTLLEQGFKFRNGKEASTCGCGKSVSFK
jgi:iron-sulfur cluster assembly protein